MPVLTRAATELRVNVFLCGAPGPTLHYQHLIWASQYKYHVSHKVKDLYCPKNVSFLHAKRNDFCDFQDFVIVLRIVLWDFTVNNGKIMDPVHTNKHRNFLMFKCSSHLYV